ncbi:hypothetical protein QBC37DRAFT_163735 [Rhypophila decipiens]|uniref:JmjC domain-containing protein n=1 Tax=Rhypophila decipiens TaxID=261697 RepID=A0AAN7BAB8_9PEZI|nr:hypothetical protein QBC37DRAFT_163735 [Rhypophila decipiens]
MASTTSPLDPLRAHCLSAAEDIQQECQRALSSFSSTATSRNSTTTGILGCDTPLIQLLQRQAGILSRLYTNPWNKEQQSDPTRTRELQLLIQRLDDLASIAYGRFYAYLFKDLPVCWRQLYTDASILKFGALFLTWLEQRDGSRSIEMPMPLDEMVRTLDLALILAGAAGKRGRGWIDESFGLLERVCRHSSPSMDLEGDPPRPTKKRRLSIDNNAWGKFPSFASAEPFTPPIKHPVWRINAISMEQFQTHLDKAPRERGPEPLVISGLVNDWPARTTHPWKKPAYLLSRTFDGRRLVPVEIGRSYVDDGWSQKIIPFGEFLSEYIDSTSTSTSTTGLGTELHQAGSEKEKKEQEKIAYLAQHQLLTQLPLLRSDITIPDLCYTSPPGHPTDSTQDKEELEEPQLNAWFGPPGTITPLHTDPYHNLLVQVVGRKYVRLYAPQETERMRRRGKEDGVEMGNTSLVDVGLLEGWDEPYEQSSEDGEEDSGSDDGFDDFRKVPYLECILEEGDTLYIPIGWWHYVRGLSVSFSVSFWWN